MDDGTDLSRQIKDANRGIYNSISPETYNSNESIFNERRQRTCNRILLEAANMSGSASSLDIGTGTGNLLRLSRNHFKHCYAVDIGENLLVKISPEFPDCFLAASDADYLPFSDGSFNFVSCYALLHHLYDHQRLFKECCRVLKPGGTLYTDHDPNYFFNRFYRVYYRMKYRHKPGFGTAMDELAEYHNSMTPGINPEKLKSELVRVGFRQVAAIYRNTDRSEWSGAARVLVPVLRILSKTFPAKSFFTHFSIIAIK